MNTHRQYINEQIRKEPKFVEALAKAEQEVGIAVELARLRERRGLYLELSPTGGKWWRLKYHRTSCVPAAHPFMDAAGKSLQPTNMLSLG
jgi:hypothetical protein